MQLPNLRRIARIAMARCTRETKFERHYIKIYQSNFLLCYTKFIPLFKRTGSAERALVPVLLRAERLFHRPTFIRPACVEGKPLQ